jgi:hypothetical protein
LDILSFLWEKWLTFRNENFGMWHGLASKPAAMVFSSLPSKLVATVSPGLASKPAVDFLVEPQNKVMEGFPVWASKPTALV